MIPVALDPGRLAVAVAGRGEAALRRVQRIAAGAPAAVLLFCDEPRSLPAGGALPGIEVRPNLPDDAALRSLDVLWIAGLPFESAAYLVAVARATRVLVNVEDRPELCDFHSVAELRRGDLLLTVSTGGESPGLAARIRARLAAEFGPEWAERTKRIGALRRRWRAEGKPLAELARLTDAAIDEAGWLA